MAPSSNWTRTIHFLCVNLGSIPSGAIVLVFLFLF